MADLEKNTPVCSCGKKMQQDFRRSDIFGDRDRVRVSNALAVDISQLESGEAQRAMPGVEFVVRGDMACPVIHNRAEKKRIMKMRGFVEYN